MGAKYEFDKTRMEFRKVTHSVWTVLGKAVKYFLVTASLAVVYYVVFSFVINTDSERKLEEGEPDVPSDVREPLRPGGTCR